MQQTVKLIIGLGNPGSDYQKTRHNAGACFVKTLAADVQQPLQYEPKFKAHIARTRIQNHEVWLMIPNTYMNNSGLPVKAVSHFYKIPPESILIAHDELDFEAGIVRLKQGGGPSGHNGLKDIIRQLGTNNFYRLRIGIGHPGHRDKVHNYVLSQPGKMELAAIIDAINQAILIVPELVAGNIQKAIHKLHSDNGNNIVG